MSDIISKYDYVKQHIPDPQVKDVADQFFDAAEFLWGQPPHSGVVVPAIINSTLSIELYLKSFTVYSVIKDIEHRENGVSGGAVTCEREKSGRTGHELTVLFDATEGWIKDEFEKKYLESSICKPTIDFRGCLSAYDSVFVKVRYVYEDSSFFTRVNVGELRALMKLIRTTIEAFPGELRVFK